MGNLSTIGRLFYGIAVAATGIQTIYYGDFPYWLIPPRHGWIPGLALLAYISGLALLLAGACIVFEKKVRPVSLLLGGVLLFIFFFCYLPFEIVTDANIRYPVWHNAEKELSFTTGAFIIAGLYAETNETWLIRFLGKLIPFASIVYALPLISFGIIHLTQAKDVSTMVPSWIPNPVFWTYFAGVALIGSGIAIILKVKLRLIATLLGIMVFTWFVILHIPRVFASPVAYLGSEITSAFLALAYSGIAFVIAGKK